MEKVEKELIRLLDDYLTGKVANFNFYNDQQTKNEVDSIIDETIESICDMLEDGDRAIDKIIENFDSTRAREDYILTTKMDLEYEMKGDL